MSMLAPPEPPCSLVGVEDDGRMRRLRFRMWQLTMAFITILVTAWFIAINAGVGAVLAIVVAKHILVAILVMGLGIDADRQAKQE